MARADQITKEDVEQQLVKLQEQIKKFFGNGSEMAKLAIGAGSSLMVVVSYFFGKRMGKKGQKFSELLRSLLANRE